MAQLYISIALSTSAKVNAGAYWSSHASTAIRKLNAKKQNDTKRWTIRRCRSEW